MAVMEVAKAMEDVVAEQTVEVVIEAVVNWVEEEVEEVEKVLIPLHIDNLAVAL